MRYIKLTDWVFGFTVDIYTYAELRHEGRLAYHGTRHDEHIYYIIHTTHVLCTVLSSFSVSYNMIHIAELHLNLHIYTLLSYIYIGKLKHNLR